MAVPGGGIHGNPTPLYGYTIQRCIAEGELDKMKALVTEAETFLKDHGNVGAALEALKIEIAKLERAS